MPARLVDDQLGTLVLDQANGFSGVQIDPGFPAPRVQQQNNINASGVNDQTCFHGARDVTLTALVLPVDGVTRRSILERLRAYCAAGRRPVLYYDEEGDGVERRLVLRGTTAGTPFQTFARQVQASWTAPSGLIEAATLESGTVSPVEPAAPGITFPFRFSFSFPAVPSNGAGSILNAGSTDAAPVYRMWGPCTDPVVSNVETGTQIVFRGLSLTADQYAEVDVAGVTYRLNGRVADNLRTYVDLPATRLAWLQPGANRLRYSPKTYGTGAHLEVLYRSAWT